MADDNLIFADIEIAIYANKPVSFLNLFVFLVKIYIWQADYKFW